MFLSKEGIEQAERILDKLKARKEKQVGAARSKMGSGNRNEESSDSVDDNILDEISEESRFDYDEFEQVIR